MMQTLNSPNWMDAHCHLADPRFSDSDLEAIIFRSKSAHVCGWVQGGVSPLDWDRQLAIQSRYGQGVVTTFGIHPWWAAEHTNEDIENALTLLEGRANQAQAIGELGLDYSQRFHESGASERQKFAFESQLEIAKYIKKPLIIHAVRSHSEVIQALQKKAPFQSGGIVHSFSGDLRVANEYLELGFLISIGGSITKNGYKNLKKAITCIPMEKIVVETDSPDQIPRLPGLPNDALNEPRNLIGIAKALASLCEIDYGKILCSSTKNLKGLFGIAK